MLFIEEDVDKADIQFKWFILGSQKEPMSRRFNSSSRHRLDIQRALFKNTFG